MHYFYKKMQKVKVMNKKKEKEIEYTEKDPLF